MNALGESPSAADPHRQQSFLLCCLLMEAEAPKCPKAPGLGSLLSDGRTARGLPVETSRGSNPSNIWTYLPPGISGEKGDPMIRAEGKKQGVSFSPGRKMPFLSGASYKPETFHSEAERIDSFPPLREPLQDSLITLSLEMFEKAN